MTDQEFKRARLHADRCRALLVRLTTEGEEMNYVNKPFMRRQRSVRKAWQLAEIAWFEEVYRRTGHVPSRTEAETLRKSYRKLAGEWPPK